MKTRSMTQKISSRFFLTSIFSFSLAAVLFSCIFYNAFKAQIWQDLASEAASIAKASDYIADPQDLAMFANDDLRISLLGADGSILYESTNTQDTAPLANNQAVLDAYQSGVGTALSGQILGVRTYYYALLLTDGSVLHMAHDAQGIFTIFYAALPAILCGCMFLLVAAMICSHFITKRILAPIMEMTRDLEHIQNNVPYRELSPFVSAIYSDRLLRVNNDKIRQEFTANVSHELKSPLTSISGYAELITMGLAKQEDIPQFATKIHAETQRMIALVDDILQLSQLDTMSVTIDTDPQFEQINLYDVGHDCIERLNINAKRAYVTLAFEGQDAMINGNRKLLEELFQNLCDNAIRYNKPGGKVILTVGRDQKNSAYLKVQDSGIGIPQDAQNRVFERFYRVDKSHSKETGGTGLGLAIVKHIVLAHEGQLSLESELGVGTQITVTF